MGQKSRTPLNILKWVLNSPIPTKMGSQNCFLTTTAMETNDWRRLETNIGGSQRPSQRLSSRGPGTAGGCPSAGCCPRPRAGTFVLDQSNSSAVVFDRRAKTWTGNRPRHLVGLGKLTRVTHKLAISYRRKNDIPPIERSISGSESTPELRYGAHVSEPIYTQPVAQVE